MSKLANTSKGGKTAAVTMAQLLSSYKATKTSHKVGEELEGTILDISPKSVLIDIGGKSEGIVTGKAFEESKSFIKSLKSGDKVRVRVLISETPEGYSVVSLRKAMHDFSWKKVNDAYKSKKPISVYAKAVNPAGVVVDVYGMSGFIPQTHIGSHLAKDLANVVGKSFEVMVIDADRQVKRIILSEKEVSEKESMDAIKKAIESVRDGDEFDGEVTTVSSFGVFVKINVDNRDIEGLVHVSELSWEKVDRPLDILKVGDKVRVKVIGKEGLKMSFSIKQISQDPWSQVEKKYKKDARLKGSVVRQSDFGVFIALEPGIEGLVHITKIPPDKKFKRGDETPVYIEEVDAKNKKISLGLVLTEKPVGYK